MSMNTTRSDFLPKSSPTYKKIVSNKTTITSSLNLSFVLLSAISLISGSSLLIIWAINYNDVKVDDAQKNHNQKINSTSFLYLIISLPLIIISSIVLLIFTFNKKHKTKTHVSKKLN